MPFLNSLSNHEVYTKRATAMVPTAMVIVALTNITRDIIGMIALITGPWIAGPRALNRGSRIVATKIDDPAQKTPKIICRMRRMINSSFMALFTFRSY